MITQHLADAGAQNPLLPSWPEFIIGTVVFAIVFGVLGKILLPRITKTLEERENAIEGGITRADEAQAEAQRVLEQYRAQLDDARHEAARIRAEAGEQGAAIIAEMRERAQAEARRITESAQAQIESERQAALQSLRSEVGSLAVELASRIVGESLADTARQGRMVDRFLSDLEGQAAGAGAPAGAGRSGASRSGAGQPGAGR
ncbi:MAG: F0F1 ATP synthase subunit B [Nocardiopsaceae bacterium]|nr:F0F1 ATP synthase subunit B [Nocardiopsaceae bacterium]